MHIYAQIFTVKNSSKDFWKSDKGKQFDQCPATFSDTTYGFHPWSCKNQTQQVLHCLLPTVETHLANQPGLLRSWTILCHHFHANHLSPSKFQWQLEGCVALKLFVSRIQSVGFCVMLEGYPKWETDSSTRKWAA